MRSMTGYGRGQCAREGREMTVEIKTVNHRFLDVALRMPRGLGFAEDALRKQLSKVVQRGHADVLVLYRNTREDARCVACDTALVHAYRCAFEEIASQIHTPALPDAAAYAALPGVLTVTEAEEDRAAVGALLTEAAALALEEMEDMRLREGAAMQADITLHLDLLEELRQAIEKRAPQVVDAYRQRLNQRMEELCGGVVDAQRIAQEAALFSDRAAIDEELARLSSHVQQAFHLMAQDAPCGSKLNFLVQEMNREVNTIGSKAMDADIAAMVVEAKAEIEKLREQIQNVE